MCRQRAGLAYFSYFFKTAGGPRVEDHCVKV
jgi:hypothetical protein